METRPRITIFHVYRNDGSALFLHPFESLEKLISILEKYDISGKYGTEPRVESLTLFRNDLYRMIEDAVKSWVSEARFIPRFVLSALVFLVTYLVLSFAVRDPIPMVDEILIGLAAAVVTYFLKSKRDQKSNIASKRRVSLRTAVDRIVFQEDPFVKQIEAALQSNEIESRENVVREMLEGSNTAFTIENEAEAKELFSYLEKRFASREYKRQERLFARIDQQADPVRDVDTLSRLADSGKIDIPLFAVYRRMKKTLRRK